MQAKPLAHPSPEECRPLEGTPSPLALHTQQRYVESYRLAASLFGVARYLRAAGLVAWAIAGLLGLEESGGPNNLIVALLTGCGLCAGCWIVSMVIAGQAHRLRATIDAAVHSSPFLSDAQKARTVALSL